MSAITNELLASRIEAAALAVPGVASVLRSGVSTRAVIDAGARLLGLGERGNSTVRIERGSEAVSVECSVGLVRTRSVVETVHELHRTISEVVRDATGLPARVRITVGHVDEAAPEATAQP
ncbi:hypothetical protein [Leucobacter chromiiresistens]|uniref:Asp23/Gls24 family envelope stress response protein n=1 Tax=Leucobacter chromiiresistens TaxID=1079994 RepID=A0A147EP22_9MICO|nr:hypothetical protein [Leucobacter chromiiresistens]KTR86110.1 hypothetical protein NS354_06335 [Leucobacter chromiiresistens]